MATTLAPHSTAARGTLAGTSDAAWYAGAMLVGLVLFYFVGIDQGATSLFGSDMHVHEFVHDARHLLGFPCH